MNYYVITIALRMMRYYWKLHLSILVQIAAGIGVVYVSFVLYHSIQTYYENLLSRINEMNWSISVRPIGDSSKYPLSYDQYKQLQDAHPNATFPVYVSFSAYIPNDEGELDRAVFLYATDDFIQSTLQINNDDFEQGETAYVGDRIQAVMNSDTPLLMMNPNAPQYHIKDQRLSMNNEAFLNIQSINELSSSQSYIELSLNFEDYNKEQIPLSHVVLLPFTAYYSIFPSVGISGLHIDMIADETVTDEQGATLIMQVLDQLLTWNGHEYNYDVNTKLQALLLSISRIRNAALVATTIAGICLIIVTLGLTGLLHALFHRRQHTFAIHTAIGVKKQTLFAGMMLEATLPSLIGGIIGTSASYYYVKFNTNFAFEMLQPASMILFAIGLSLLPGLFSTSTLVYRIRKLQPLEMIRKGGG